MSISITLRGSPHFRTHLPLMLSGVGMSARGSLKVHSYSAPASDPSWLNGSEEIELRRQVLVQFEC